MVRIPLFFFSSLSYRAWIRGSTGVLLYGLPHVADLLFIETNSFELSRKRPENNWGITRIRVFFCCCFFNCLDFIFFPSITMLFIHAETFFIKLINTSPQCSANFLSINIWLLKRHHASHVPFSLLPLLTAIIEQTNDLDLLGNVTLEQTN